MEKEKAQAAEQAKVSAFSSFVSSQPPSFKHILSFFGTGHFFYFRESPTVFLETYENWTNSTDGLIISETYFSFFLQMCLIAFYVDILTVYHLRNVWSRNQAWPQLLRQGLLLHLPPPKKWSLVHYRARAPPLPRWFCPPRWAPLSHSSRTRTSSSHSPLGWNRAKAHKVCYTVFSMGTVCCLLLPKLRYK